jgi:hypothetical protein
LENDMPIEPRRVTFRNAGLDVVGHIRVPEGFDERTRYPSVVVVGPGSAVIPPALIAIVPELKQAVALLLTSQSAS